MNVFEQVINEAAKTGGRIKIEYKNSVGAISEREISEISVSGNNFRAKCELRGEERHFRIDRIIAIERKLR